MAGAGIGGQRVPANINTASAQALQGAGMGTAQGMAYQPGMVGRPNTPYYGGQAQQVGTGGQTGMVRTPQATYFGGNAQMVGTGGTTPQVQAGQLATTNLAQYQNPYTQQVIDAQAQDVLRNAQLGLNQLGTQAQKAGAFGGSRHGIAMGEIGRNVAQTLGQQSAQLRQQGFNTAQQMAQQDIATRMQGSLANQQAAANDLSRQLQAQGMNQQAAESEAARRLQASTSTGQMGLQAALANQQTMANDLSRQLQAQGMNQQAAENQAQRMLQASTTGSQLGMQGALANQQAGLQGAQLRLGAANQLGQLGNLGFGIGQQINANMMQQGAMQQALQQQLVDQAKAQYQGYTQAPVSSLGYVSSALGASPIPQSTTSTRQPGLYDYLTMAATAASGTNFMGG